MNHRVSKWAWAAAIWSAAVLASPVWANGLDVRVTVPSPVLSGDVDVAVTVTVTNTLRHPQRIAKAQLPQGLDMAQFHITRDGQPVPYTGPLVKRGAPRDSDYVRLGAGESLRYEVELTGLYDLSRNGQYAIHYTGLQRQHGPAQEVAGSASTATTTSAQAAAAVEVSTAPLYVWLQGRSEPKAETSATLSAQASVQPLATAAAASITYTGNCSSSQRTALANAVTGATTYAQNALTYLGRTPASTPRYKTWFGSVTTTNWNTVKSHFSKITDALKTKPLTLDCSCRQDYYAYVYADQPYKVYLCPAFFSAPATGTDSKAGTLVHELSHFTVLGGTDDRAYGQSAAKSLASSSPSKAIDNADSHEYFAENNPALQ